MLRTVRAYSRRFAASATGFARRYRQDVLYRTGWNVVFLQLGFAGFLLAFITVFTSQFYTEVVSTLLGTLSDIIESGTTYDPATLTDNLRYAKDKNLILAGTAILIMAAVFGYLITRLALTPTKNALESQKQFVGNIAHELRTPLSIIKTNTEVALFNQKLDKDTREALVSNTEELDRVSDIINNLLSMNRLLRPEKIEFGNVNLSDVIDRVGASLEAFAERKSISVRVFKNGRGFVWGNASAVDQIVMNIVKNALNYTLEGGEVRVSYSDNSRGGIDFVVEDTGVGISETDLEHIFEPFYRGDRSRNRKSGGGSGLGLAIVSELVKIHKGSISIQSKLGKGTRVRVSLPAGKNTERFRAGGPGEINIDFSAKGS